jgi:hypothetical protein
MQLALGEKAKLDCDLPLERGRKTIPSKRLQSD